MKMPKLPEFKRPTAKVKRPSVKRPSIKTPNVKAPKFLSDIGKDLRDRRLLIPVIALVVALVAVPVVLSSSGSEATPPPAPSVSADVDATAVESAVLTEQVGIRNYRKRLAALKKKNPFEQKFTFPKPSESKDDQEAASTTPVDTSTTSTSSTESASSGGGSVSETDTTTVSGGGDTTVSETVTETEPVEPPKPEIRFYAGRVDVTVGPLGAAKTYENVHYLDFLPNDKSPIVAFLGLGEGGDKAIFSVSSDVAETDGEGSCAPKKPDPCQFLTLRIGEQRTLKTVDGETYRLKLLDTHVVRVPDPRDEDEPAGNG